MTAKATFQYFRSWTERRPDGLYDFATPFTLSDAASADRAHSRACRFEWAEPAMLAAEVSPLWEIELVGSDRDGWRHGTRRERRAGLDRDKTPAAADYRDALDDALAAQRRTVDGSGDL